MTYKLVLLILVLFGLTAYSYGTYPREEQTYPVGKGNTITCGDKNHLQQFEMFIPQGANKSEFIEGFCKSIHKEQDNE